MRLEGIHHVTAIMGDAPETSTSRACARPAARQEDGQPGRPDRLPPLLRGRARVGRRGHHVRVPGRKRRAGAGMVHRVVFRVGSESALDPWEERLRARTSPSRAVTGA